MRNYKKLLNPEKTVNHIAIIMDGNGRWAQKRSLPRIEGHRKGAEVIEPIVESAAVIGVKAISLYAFSTENWARPKSEINELWNVLEIFAELKKKRIIENDVRIRISGTDKKLPKSTKRIMNCLVKDTENNSRITVNICLNYGGHQEIVDSVNKWIVNRKSDELLTPKKLSQNLYTAGLPDVDLMIRTGGEYRISNFLLWQMAYTEFVFSEVLWPDFKPNNLYKAVYEFQNRKRRFGGL